MSDEHSTEERTVELEFPCEFIFKVMGKNSDEFTQTVLETVQATFPDATEADVTQKPSNKGNYLSVNVRVQADNQEQLDTVYRKLHDNDLVLMTL